jgi:hypothetical protein
MERLTGCNARKQKGLEMLEKTGWHTPIFIIQAAATDKSLCHWQCYREIGAFRLLDRLNWGPVGPPQICEWGPNGPLTRAIGAQIRGPLTAHQFPMQKPQRGPQEEPTPNRWKGCQEEPKLVPIMAFSIFSFQLTHVPAR